MHLVQVLLPVFYNDGNPVAQAHFLHVRQELTKQFGGVTCYSRAPAEGIWQQADGAQHEVHDEMILFEVMVDALDHTWWTAYRQLLAERFQQREIVVRAFALTPL